MNLPSPFLGSFRSGASRSGFTLLELLATISVISVLAVMLMSAAGGVRSKAKSAQCLSNLHQICIASQLYSSENDGYPPPAHFNEALKPFANGIGQIEAETRTKNIWICPADERANKDTGSGPVSYSYNPDVAGWPKETENGVTREYFEKAKIRWAAVGLPAKTIMFLDADMYYCDPGNRWAAFRHSKALNAAFFDGHVETLKFDDPTKIYDQSYWNNN